MPSKFNALTDPIFKLASQIYPQDAGKFTLSLKAKDKIKPNLRRKALLNIN